MKKIIIPIIASCIAFLPSCSEDNLEIDQKGVTSIDSFYKTDDDAEAAMVAVYQGFIWNMCAQSGGYIYSPFRAAFNNCGDDMFAAGEFLGDNDFMADLNEFRYDNGNSVLTNCYQNIYYAMYYTNLVIDRFKDGLPDKGQTETTKRVVAESRVMRAYMHMMLALGWNNPPKVDHVLDAGAMPENCDHDELLNWCAQECEEAAEFLEERKGPNDKEGAIKVTKGFAWAVAGKCYMHLDAPNYAKAKENLKKVITSNKYALVPGNRYEENFHVEGDCNEEKIFEANVAYNPNAGTWSGMIQRTTWMQANLWGWRSSRMVYRVNQEEYSSIEGWGGCGVPKSFADEFVANDGEDSYRLKASIISIEDLMYGKLIEWKPIKGMSLDEIKKSDKIGLVDLGLYGQSKYLMLKKNVKKTDLQAPGVNQSMINHCIMRYAEVLLLYAEACIQSGDNAEAKKYINMIQERAGSKTISASVDMNVLKREKKLEMWLEGCRWYDMRRWNDYELAKKAGMEVTTLCDKVTRPIKAGDKVIEDGERFYLIDNHDHATKNITCPGYSEKFKYFPFPTSVISKNPNLKQREGF